MSVQWLKQNKIWINSRHASGRRRMSGNWLGLFLIVLSGRASLLLDVVLRPCHQLRETTCFMCNGSFSSFPFNSNKSVTWFRQVLIRKRTKNQFSWTVLLWTKKERKHLYPHCYLSSRHCSESGPVTPTTRLFLATRGIKGPRLFSANTLAPLSTMFGHQHTLLMTLHIYEEHKYYVNHDYKAMTHLHGWTD